MYLTRHGIHTRILKNMKKINISRAFVVHAQHKAIRKTNTETRLFWEGQKEYHITLTQTIYLEDISFK